MEKALKIENFSYHYPDGTFALDDISLDIDHGQKVALIGPNGAGKSTLLLGIAGFIKGTGKVFIDSLELNRPNLKSIRRRLGSCLENPDDQLFMPRLSDDVAFGPLNMGLNEEEVVERTTWALEQVQMSDFAGRMPHRLSLGEKKKAAIATVLSMKPTILALDEPSVVDRLYLMRRSVCLFQERIQGASANFTDCPGGRDCVQRCTVLPRRGILHPE